MDNQTPPAQSNLPNTSSIPMNPVQSTPKTPKRNTTIWVILLLLLGAALLTGVAYFFIPQSKINKNTQATTTNQTTPSQTKNPQEKSTWQTYTNKKYQYSFFYPVTWKITKADTNQKTFELHNTDGSDSGIIKISYVTSDEQSKMEPFGCESKKTTSRCLVHKISEKNQAMVEQPAQPDSTKFNALITHPDGGILLFQISDSNADSEYAFNTLLDTLTYVGDKRTNVMQICPDTWPTNEKTVDYNGVKIPTNEIDAAWIKNNCTYP